MTIKRIKGYRIMPGIFLLLVLGAVVFFTGNTGGDPDSGEYSENRVAIAEIKSELGFGVYSEEDWDTWFSSYHQDYLTGGMLEQLLTRLGVESYIELPEMSARHTVTRSEWNPVYLQILDYLDMEKEIGTELLLVLDMMEADDENVLITNQGDYYTALPVSYFGQWNVYDVYVTEEKCVGIAGISQAETTVSNAYLKDFSEEEVDFLYDGSEYRKETGQIATEIVSGVCDLVFADGQITTIRMKQDVIYGELLSYDDSAIEVEGYGKISHQGKIPVYQTYGGVAEKSISDIVLGNMEVEYVTGENEVCAILIRQPASIENIRVLLLAEDGGKFRETVYLKAGTQLLLKCGEREETVAAETLINVSDYLAAAPESTLILAPDSIRGQVYLCDADGNAVSNGYFGSMEVRVCDEGYTLVNELLLETYLYAVVPSEMPSSYAPEAQKAQAVCARSYAYTQLLRADLAEYGAHINDSTSYQVYNKTAPTEASMTAVNETAGQVLTYQGETVEAYYFSTSVGYTDTAEVWNVDTAGEYGYLKQACLIETPCEGDLSDESAFLDYIQTTPIGYDSDIKYYRWTAIADYSEKTDEIAQILNQRRSVSAKNILYYDVDQNTERASMEGMGELTEISVWERSESGSILTLKLRYEKGVVLVKTEHNIRKVLGCGVEQMTYADSSTSSEITMLPSAFAAVTAQGDGTYLLQGGGYGHGLGMSQNAANGMAKAGMNYEEILQYFYNDVKISDMQ